VADIRLENVSFAIGGTVVLHKLDFQFSGHGVTGLIGPNGSGKSTLLQILARQLTATSGTILLGGKPIEAMDTRDFARTVAYLPQYTPLAAGLKVHELVALGRYPWHGAFGRFSAEDQRKVDEALELTSTSRLTNQLVDTLSGGERQRVWLAMLLAQNARWLLLDEPISALDVAHQVEVLELVHRLSADNGISVIIVIHDINMAVRYCDRMVALKSGKILAHGLPQEFMTESRLAEIYDVSMGIVQKPDAGGSLAYVRG